MRIFANLFLILFLADGIASLVDELLLIYPATTLFSGVRSFIAWMVMVVSIPFYICLGIDKRLPKRLFLPQCILIFWSFFDLWPLPLMLDKTTYALPVALGQIALGVWPLLYLRRKSGKDFFLTPKMFFGPLFGIKHTLVFGAIHVVLLPAILVFMAISIASLQLDAQTGGFARLLPNGIHMSERVYRLDQKEIRLTSMIHIADKDYFDKVVESISSKRTIVLAEGVTDRDNRVTHKFSYEDLARNLGLSSQEKMHFAGKIIEPDNLQLSASAANEEAYHILRADIDMNDLHPKTVEFLNIIGKNILSSTSISEGVRTYFDWVRKNSDLVTPDTIMNDILYRRNQEVIHHMQNALSHYDTIIIPWGALHMPEIETAILDRGFVLSETRNRMSVDFKKMFFALVFN